MEEFANKVKDAKSVDEIKAIAKECGLELADDKAEELFKMISNQTGELSDGELSDDELEAVAGGGIVDTIKHWVGSLFGR